MKPPEPIIRRVAQEDSDLNHARHMFRSYAEEFAESIAESLCFQGFDAEVAGLPGRYAAPTGCLLLSLDNEIPIGCVAMRDLGGGTCEMKRLYVSPAGRGRGVGRQLVSEIILMAEQAGFRRMVLDTLPEMDRAITLYREFGFVEIAPYWSNPVDRAIYFERSLEY
jgi:putative acetyltransferase